MFSCTVAKCIEFFGGGIGILMLMWLMGGMLYSSGACKVEFGGSEAGSCSLVKPEGQLRRVVHGVWSKLTSMWKADVSFFLISHSKSR